MEKPAEELLADEIHFHTALMLFSVIDDLETFIAKGILRQSGGSVLLGEIKLMGSLESIYVEFETIPGKTPYYLTYHGKGGFYQGNRDKDLGTYWENFCKKRGAKPSRGGEIT